MVMFKINDVDYSEHVVGSNYIMNNEDITKNWVDISGVTHKQLVRKQIIGSFDMMFKTLEEYERFLSDLNNAKDSSTRAVHCVVAVNYPENVNMSIDAFIKIQPTRAIDGAWKDIFQQFSVKVEEM